MEDIDKNYILIGKLGAPYGVKGYVKLISYSDPLANILSYSLFEYEQNKKIVPFLCEDSKVFKNGKIIIKLPGVDNPEQARLSTGKEIFTTTADLPDLEDDGYYWHDLVGLSVINAAGHEFGRVEYLFNSGASDIIVVKNSDGTEVLIPYLDHVVIKVDLTERTMLIAWEE